MTTDNGSTLSQIEQTATTMAAAAAPFLPPRIQLALALATAAMNAVNAAMTNGTDISDAQLSELFAADDKAAADDLLARQAMTAAAATLTAHVEAAAPAKS